MRRKCYHYLVSLLGVLLVSGCAQNEKVKGAYPPQTPKFVEGAGLGAVGGAAIGGLAGGSTSAAVAGLGVGAAIGAPIGSYYDGEGLIKELQHQGITVVRLGDILELNIPADLIFDGAETEIKYSAYPMMNQVVHLLQQYGQANMVIEAHTDNIGSTLQKLEFSRLQAQSVTTYLWSHGIQLPRMEFYGMGDRQSVAQYRTTLGSAYNRRVSITLWRDGPPSPVNIFTKNEKDPCWTKNDPESCHFQILPG